MNLSQDAQKLLKWMAPHSAKSLQEILNWGPLGDVSPEYVQSVCGELVEAGELVMKVPASGGVVYWRAAKT